MGKLRVWRRGDPEPERDVDVVWGDTLAWGDTLVGWVLWWRIPASSGGSDGWRYMGLGYEMPWRDLTCICRVLHEVPTVREYVSDGEVLSAADHVDHFRGAGGR